MAQDFLISAAVRSLRTAKIMRMSDHGIENVFLRLRWPATDGKPLCPGCGCIICYACPRPMGQPRWRCKACQSCPQDPLPARKDIDHGSHHRIQTR